MLNFDRDFYITVTNYKKLGVAFDETDFTDATKVAALEKVMDDENVTAVIYFNPSEGVCENVSEDIALMYWKAICKDFDCENEGLPRFIQDHSSVAVEEYYEIKNRIYH